MEAARAFLEMHQRDGDQLFSRIVTGDESWVHHSTPETKRQSMVWKKPEESAPKKAKVTISAGKVMAMENFKWEIFTHPPYSPELAPSDFHLFPALKWHLGGKHFANDDEVQAEANHWLLRQDTACYNSGIKKLLQRYQKCLDRNGDYLEKLENGISRRQKNQHFDICFSSLFIEVKKQPKQLGTYAKYHKGESNKKWFAKFKNGNLDLEDTSRSERPSEFDEEHLKALLKEDGRQTIRDLAKKKRKILLQPSSINRLGAWVPHELNQTNKEIAFQIAAQHLARHQSTRGLKQRFLYRIVTRD
ncbi:hypothetical protein LAZ67_15000503 [Cordylochernes scorpioides]|uniref:Transposase n=1 Tax=Cordylochernes scorpioides TaxID=51811 RepID=A0ABY6LBM4_9ARAC|nr:hypothetical protein LAZ67_15000503 [Cordylochernes scorpioides]